MLYFEETFAALFRGRLEAHGGEEGQSIKTFGADYAEFERRVELHLNTPNPMGVYPLIPTEHSWECWWGCVDFDEGDEPSLIHATNLQTVLAEFWINGWVERSRSKGYHVWVFAEEAVPAALMRRALLAATQIAQAPTKEINPKSEGFFNDDGTVDRSKLGNYVRLPYPHGSTERRVVIEPHSGDVYSAEGFVVRAWESRAARSALESLSKLWVRPKSSALPRPTAQREVLDGELPSTSYMTRQTHALYRLGPFENRPDRSAALWRLANRLREDGYSEAEALAFLRDADARWGKFIARGDGDRLVQLAAKVYTDD